MPKRPAEPKSPVSDELLYKLLLKNQYINMVDLDGAFEQAQKEKQSLYEAVLEKDLISDENIGKLLADYYNLPFVILSKVVIPKNILKIIPEKFVDSHKIVAFSQKKGVLEVATSKPLDFDPIEFISKKAGMSVKVYFATERDIADSLKLYRKALQSTFDELLKEQVEKADAASGEMPVSKVVDTLIEYAYEDKASDIHIEPSRESTLIRFRIDGILHDVLNIPNLLHDQLVTRIKVLSRLRTDEHLSAQDGKFQADLKKETLDVRVSIVPIVEGEKVVLRLLTARSRQFGLTDLGMNDADLDKVNKGFNAPYGMVLSTGPTGSGKTTTMYAILKILNKREKNIATIEDPVEYDIEGINQIQVNPKTNLTFAEGLRSILRQDPDIIYVGEIRDNETADIAINSAMTGHLVLSTLHTNDAATALPRLIDMGIEPFLVSSTINVIIAQRLIRKICDKCKVSYTLSVEDLVKHFTKELIIKHLGQGESLRLYKGKGCPVCHGTGYNGRIGIFEVLAVTDSVKELIAQRSDSSIIMKKAREEGMSTMLEDGLDKIQRGQTSIEEVLRATTE